MDKNLLEQQLSELPLYTFFYIDPAQLEFSDRIRYICQAECPRYGKSWACPPGVGSVTECKAKCLGYQECLVVGTWTLPASTRPWLPARSTKSLPTRWQICCGIWG